MPSITIEKNDMSKISIPETLTIHVNKNCIAIQKENSLITLPSSKITEIHKNINRQLKSDHRGQAYDNSLIHIYTEKGFRDIRSGPYTEELYNFILKNLYDLNLENEEDDSESVSGFTYKKIPSVYSKN
jgi:hypothetical protein